MALQHSNIAVITDLNGGITDVATSLIVTLATGYPAVPFVIKVSDITDETVYECMLVEGKSGTTFSSLTRGYGGTTAAAWVDTDVVKHVVIGEEINVPLDSWLANLFSRPSDETAHADDDEFDDETVDAAWTIVQPSGTQSIVEKGGLMSIRPLTASTSSDMAAYMKAIPAAGLPITIEVAVRIFSSIDGSDYMMAGPIFSDGTATGSGITMSMAFPTGGVFTIDGRQGTFTAVTGLTFSTIINPTPAASGHSVFYQRLIWSAANTFKMGFSPDGVNWLYSTGAARTLTPTHMGFGWSTWGDTPAGERWNTYEYFRVTEADLSV